MSRPICHLLTTTLLGTLCAASHAPAQLLYPTATVSVGGAVQANDSGGNYQVDFNGYLELIHYGQFSSPASLASGLAALFTRDYKAFGLYAKAGAHNGTDPTVVTFQLTSGSIFAAFNLSGLSPSFTFTPSGFGNPVSGTPDIGTVALQFNGGTIATASYGEGSTPATIAEQLAQTARSSLVRVTSEGQNVYLESRQTGTYSSPYNLVFTTTQPGFSQPSFSSPTGSGQLTGSSLIAPTIVYSYTIGQSGYDAAGNMVSLTDSVMGNWRYGYDTLNRLTGGQAATGNYAGQSTCWTYDSFGNRTSQSVSTVPCSASPPATFAATYSANNQIASVTTPAGRSVTYDAAGNVTGDGQNTYLYDAESRICAVHGPQGMIGYQYDSDGHRVGKGTVTSMVSCDVSENGYQATNEYIYDQGGAQMTEVNFSNGTPSWQHTNVTANGTLIATYDIQGLHFYLNDPLGTRRVQADAAGFPEQTCESLPFGDRLYCTESNSFPTEHHFTGKERDSESGLDYFGARHYSSTMGRFMSPDWADDPIPIPYANLANPQSLNLYSYVGNNPLSEIDEDCHDGALPTATCDSMLCRLINLFRPTPAPPGPPPPPPPPTPPTPTPTPTPAPPNSRTDVVLASDEIPVKALAVNPFLYTTTWYAFGFNNGSLGKRQPNGVITLDESMTGGPFRRTGDPSKGSANDQLMSGPPVDQRWSVDGKRVRLVTSRDKDGKLVLTWEVHVVRGGARPSYSPVP